MHTNEISFSLERLGRLLQNDAHVHGLKPTQWEVLRYLARANTFSSNPSAVTAYLGMTKGTVSQTITALARKNLIVKKAGPSKRNIQLSLTKDGRALLKRDPHNASVKAGTDLSAQERKVLADSLGKLLRSALEKRGGRPFGLCKTCRHFKGNKPYFCQLLKVPLSTKDSQKNCIEYC